MTRRIFRLARQSKFEVPVIIFPIEPRLIPLKLVTDKRMNYFILIKKKKKTFHFPPWPIEVKNSSQIQRTSKTTCLVLGLPMSRRDNVKLFKWTLRIFSCNIHSICYYYSKMVSGIRWTALRFHDRLVQKKKKRNFVR